MKMKVLLVLVLMTYCGISLAQAPTWGEGSVSKFSWFTSADVQTTSVEGFLPIPDTAVSFSTKGRSTDAVIHFCGQLDQEFGGRTQMRVSVDGELAEPNLAPGPIMSWDSFLPVTKCMTWIAPGLLKGSHIATVEWAHDLGGAGTYSTVAYRTLIVYY